MKIIILTTILKWVAICLNVFSILIAILIAINIGFKWNGFHEFVESSVWVVLGVTPVLSIVTLLTISGKSWLALYIQRRKLEEQFKIERLLSGSDRCRDFYSDEIHHEN